ncbi:MAG: DUF3365 domain-containing protein [Betaproteobacteria bacterium]|nr:DUF3365 domain-containing protein [Betaproteobacteria bacterium]
MLKSVALKAFSFPMLFPILESVWRTLPELWKTGTHEYKLWPCIDASSDSLCRSIEEPGQVELNFMMRFLIVVGLATSLAAVAMAAALPEISLKKTTDESRRVALQVSVELKNQLLREMQLSGPVRSLLVCRYTCPEILSAQSRKSGWKVAAVSLKPRNSALGMPDAWEQEVLMDFERRAARGEKVDALEFSEVVSEPQASYFRYARAMMMEPLCLPCHGSRDKMSDAVKAQLALDYPFDKAVDFSIGQVYGIVSIKRPF